MTTPTPPRSVWWRRNRLWLALLLPLLGLAVAASSFRMLRLYQPWEWSRPVVAHATTGTLRQEFRGFDNAERTREVTVSVLSATAEQQIDRAAAVPGGTLWRVELELSAASDQILDGCTVELADADGTRYGHSAGQQQADPGRFFLPPVLIDCVPPDAPGPRLAPLTGALEPSPVERPPSWRQTVAIAMPVGVEPTSVRIMWSLPEFLVLELPA